MCSYDFLYFYIFVFLFSFLLGKGGDSLLTISRLLNGGDKIYEMLALYTAELLHVTQMVGACSYIHEIFVFAIMFSH